MYVRMALRDFLIFLNLTSEGVFFTLSDLVTAVTKLEMLGNL